MSPGEDWTHSWSRNPQISVKRRKLHMTKTRVKWYLREEVLFILICHCLLPRHLLVSGGGGRPRVRRTFAHCSHFYGCLTLPSGRKFCAVLEEGEIQPRSE